MANKKISELDQTLNLSDQADFPMSQDNGGEPTTFKAKLTQIATKIAEAITFSNLKTGNKQLVSAVNQTISNLADDFNTTAGSTYAKDDCVLYNGVLYQCNNSSGTTSGTFIDADWTAIKAVDVGSGGGGGSSTFAGLSDVSINDQTLTNGQVPVYNSTTHKWENGNASGGSGGHTILDDSGTALTQRSNMQFKGAYSEDNSTDGITEVNVIRSMTKAEFDALPANEKQGIINITDITDGDDDRFQPVIYSEEEREIGVWIDGKPLYQKTLKVAPIALSNGTTIPHGVSDLEILADAFIVLHRSNGEFYMPYTSTYKNTSNFVIQGDNLVFVSTDSWTASDYVNLYATLRYTKTTDTAGSGTWTPQGVPAVHYSTDEQVVGTWVDGSTLYEKTIAKSQSLAFSSQTVVEDLTSLNIDTFVGFYGARFEADGNMIVADAAMYMLYDETSKELKGMQRYSERVIAGVLFVTIRYTKSST